MHFSFLWTWKSFLRFSDGEMQRFVFRIFPWVIEIDSNECNICKIKIICNIPLLFFPLSQHTEADYQARFKARPELEGLIAQINQWDALKIPATCIVIHMNREAVEKYWFCFFVRLLEIKLFGNRPRWRCCAAVLCVPIIIFHQFNVAVNDQRFCLLTVDMNVSVGNKHFKLAEFIKFFYIFFILVILTA